MQLRQVEVNQLWVQDKVRKGEIELEKIGGKINTADALTKECGSESLRMHVKGTSAKERDGRHELAPAIVDEGSMS